MKCELVVVSGARAGHREVYEKSYIGIGRHPLSDLRFDAEQDLDASARHAAILKQGDTFVLRDLGSTNGTFVNGERLSADRLLHDGDTLRFGVHGPEVRFQLLRESHDEVVMAAIQAPQRPSPSPKAARIPDTPLSSPRPAAEPAGTREPPATLSGSASGGQSVTGILRAEIRDQRTRFHALALSLFIVVAGAVAVILWQGRTATGHIEVTRVQLDSLRSVIVQLQRLQARADSQAQALRAELAAERDPSRREALRRRLGATEQRREQIAVATGVDWNAVVRANRPAVAMLYVRFPDSSMWSGTAFSVDPQGRMLTNRHLVVNEAGERAVEIAIQFSGSPEVLPARIERVSRDADLAVVRPMTAGPFPAVAGLGDAEPGEGDPIGLLGFPLGRDLPQGASPTASLFNGSISRILPDSLLQLDAWSGTGASGSPIFDRAGRVIGVEFGGIRDTGGRVVLGLPIRRARVLLGS